MLSIIDNIVKGTQYILLKTVPHMEQIFIYFYSENKRLVISMLKPALTVLITAKLSPENEE